MTLEFFAFSSPQLNTRDVGRENNLLFVSGNILSVHGKKDRKEDFFFSRSHWERFSIGASVLPMMLFSSAVYIALDMRSPAGDK